MITLNLNLNRRKLKFVLLRDVCIFCIYVMRIKQKIKMAENNKKKGIFVRVVRSQM
jgi:hypothetical protein